MINGVVSEDGVPTIPLYIADEAWSATIDTGFNGDLELPEQLRDVLRVQFVGRVTSALAGGQVIEEDVYMVEFPFDGSVIQAVATFVDDVDILIGTHLLQQYQLNINFVHKTVMLEQL